MFLERESMLLDLVLYDSRVVRTSSVILVARKSYSLRPASMREKSRILLMSAVRRSLSLRMVQVVLLMFVGE